MTSRRGALRVAFAHAGYQALLAALTLVAGIVFVVRAIAGGRFDADLRAWALARLGWGAAARPTCDGSRPVWVHCMTPQQQE